MTDVRTIRVTGKGQIKVKPDMTRVYVSLKGSNPEYGETLRISSEDTERLRELLAGLGFERSDLKTISFDVDAKRETYKTRKLGGGYQVRIVGYEFEHRMKVEFESDNERLGKILYALGNSHVEPEFSVSFFVKDPEIVRNELLAAAVVDSKKKALVMTQAAGVTLKDVQNIDYSWGQIKLEVQPIENVCYAPQAEGESESYDLNIEPTDIEISDTVTILWEIG